MSGLTITASVATRRSRSRCSISQPSPSSPTMLTTRMVPTPISLRLFSTVPAQPAAERFFTTW